MKQCVIFSLLALLLVNTSLAQEKIYKWKDAKGKVHYSNSPVKNAIPANLPEVKKEDIVNKIKTIKKNTPKNCLSRGGVDCSKGADVDGSVFCLDGYSESELPFSFHCLQAQLEAEISFNQADEENTKVSIVLRNLSPVEAKNISLVYHYREAFKAMGRKKKLPLLGENKIPAFGLETYEAKFKRNSRITTIKALKRGRPILKCDNCKSLKKKL